MTKNYRLQNLDCANCAAKMERKVNKIKGVSSATINFMTMKMIIDLDENRVDEIMAEVEKAMKTVESDIKILRA